MSREVGAMSGRRLEIRLRPEVLRWARERAGLTPEVLARRLGVTPRRVREWEDSGQITVAQADRLAHHTCTPVGYLYLSEPPADRLPIPDFRTAGDQAPPQPSLELLDTIRAMQRRQAWLRDELIAAGFDPLPFVGSAGLDMPPPRLAASIREALGLAEGWADTHRTWTDALRGLRERIESTGVTVVINGVVGNNTHRPLDPNEFRGFVLVDEYAPLLFINGADFVSAQMFTLVHELAHLWTGQSGVSNFETMTPSPRDVEKFCNAVAAEVLIPERELQGVWPRLKRTSNDVYSAVARAFKVSTIVAARRLFDLRLISRDEFFGFYETWERHERRQKQTGGDGGDFWRTQNIRIGHRFGLAVVRAVKEHRLLYREAYSLTGLRGKTFDTFVRQMEAEL
jgi:Zn-dependent peptidase ImmA (M78 family)/transcriptional regulator with XRE-family HTH domain